MDLIDDKEDWEKRVVELCDRTGFPFSFFFSFTHHSFTVKMMFELYGTPLPLL